MDYPGKDYVVEIWIDEEVPQELRIMAIEKIDDQKMLKKLVKSPLETIRIEVVKKITDQDLLEEIILNDPDFSVRVEAVAIFNKPLDYQKLIFLNIYLILYKLLEML